MLAHHFLPLDMETDHELEGDVEEQRHTRPDLPQKQTLNLRRLPRRPSRSRSRRRTLNRTTQGDGHTRGRYTLNHSSR